MEALAELIREKGYKVVKLEKERFRTLPYMVEYGDNQVFIRQGEGHFVATGRISGFPVTSHGYGGALYRFVI